MLNFTKLSSKISTISLELSEESEASGKRLTRSLDILAEAIENDLLLGEYEEDPRKIGISEKDLLTCHVEEITPDMLAELEYTG